MELKRVPSRGNHRRIPVLRDQGIAIIPVTAHPCPDARCLWETACAGPVTGRRAILGPAEERKETMGIYIQKNRTRLPIGGGTKELEKRMTAVENSRGSATACGLVSLSDSSAVTDSTGKALPASEKNAALPGTLAYGIANKTMTEKELLSVQECTGAVADYVTKELSDSIANYNLLCFSIGFQGYAAEDALTIPVSRFRYAGASVDLDVGQEVAANVRYDTDTTVQVSSIYDNRWIHIYGLKV